ncbi:MAG: hypothetical protein HGA39_08520 [Coriobacteriia bacterium]|nr:hypothetical protein [Coriobacteriia bacterium]
MEIRPEHRSGKDRRVARHYRFFNRRSGFDRRKSDPLFAALRDSRWVLVGLLVLLNVMSLADGLLTAFSLWLGIAKEGNPVLGSILGASPLLAAWFKVAVMIVVSYGIWRGRRYRAVLVLAPITLAIYAMVLGYHLGSLNGLGWL